MTRTVAERMRALVSEGEGSDVDVDVEAVLKACKHLGPLLAKIKLPKVPPNYFGMYAPNEPGMRRQRDMLKALKELVSQYPVWFH